MTPLDKETVIQTAQIVLAYLSRPDNSTPNDMLEGIVSGKSLLRGLVSGQLIVCTATDVEAPPAPKKKAAPKKAA